MPFAGPETTLAATILLGTEGDFPREETRALARPQLRSTTFQQLARRLNNFREKPPEDDRPRREYDLWHDSQLHGCIAADGRDVGARYSSAEGEDRSP